MCTSQERFSFAHAEATALAFIEAPVSVIIFLALRICLAKKTELKALTGL